MRIQAGLVAVAMCAAMGSCARTPAEPSARGTIEPSITESSPMPTADVDNVACALLSADERSAVAGYPLNAELPVYPQPGTYECIWVRSARQPARAAIRVVAFSTPKWVEQLVPQLQSAINSPFTDKKLAVKLRQAMEEVIADPTGLSDEDVCRTYVLLAESRGALLGLEQVSYSTIGAMPAAYAITCADGVMTMAGYGEYGVRPSLALSRSVVKLTDAASERAAEVLKDAGPGDAGDTPDDEADGSPEPSPTVADEADTEDEDES